MPVVTTDALILHAFDYAETSRILKLLTREHGLQSVIAKGARRPRSRFGGILEPFTEGSATFQLREHGDLHTLSGFDLTRTAHRLGRDLLRLGGASLIAEILLRTGIEQPDAALFEGARAGIRAIEEAPREALEPTILTACWRLIAQLGFAPAFDACVACGTTLQGDDDASFDYAAGAIRCAGCAPGAPGRPLPRAAREALAGMAAGDVPALERTLAHWRLLSRFLAHHVVDGPLQSMTFIAEALPEDAL
jgi:DNA repair protein RecO (recombination protein O)